MWLREEHAEVNMGGLLCEMCVVSEGMNTLGDAVSGSRLNPVLCIRVLMLKEQLFHAAHWRKVKGNFIQRLWQWDFCNEGARLGSAPSTAWANGLSIAKG